MKTFRHGVHPPESKDETNGLPIRQFPFSPLLIIPLVQHMGAPSIPEVEEGQEVVLHAEGRGVFDQALEEAQLILVWQEGMEGHAVLPVAGAMV